MKKPKQKKSFILRVALLLVTVYVVFSLVQLQIQVSDSNAKVSQAQEELEKQNNKNEELKRLLENGKEAEIVERIARERLDYVMPDEKVFYDISGN